MRKILQEDSIVIVCEGTTTEYNYFSECAEWVKTHYPNRFADIKVVPHPDERIDNPNPKRKNLRRSVNNAPSYHYHTVEEDSLQLYNKYKQQPTRYVREAQLIMDREGYTEAWAVYDKDVHTDHAGADVLQRSDSRLHIAYSGYSFEEWLLCHFERNPFAFNMSDCEDANKKSLWCGTGKNSADCHGTVCIAGRIRERNYIPNFDKSDCGLFETYTIDSRGQLNRKPLINSSWTRFISREDLMYQCNPYTNVDDLVNRLLDHKQQYSWQGLGGIFAFNGTMIKLLFDTNVLTIEVVDKRKALLLKSKMVIGWDNNYESEHDLFLQTEIVKPSSCVHIKIPQGIRFIAMKESDIRCIVVEL